MEEEILIAEEQINENEKLMKRSKFLIISFFTLFIIDLFLFIYFQQNKLYIFSLNRGPGKVVTPASTEFFSYVFYIIILISIGIYIAFAISYRNQVRLTLEKQIDEMPSYKKLFDWADIFSVVPIFLLLISIISGLFYSVAVVDGASMKPTYYDNDTVIIRYTDKFEKGDIVIAYSDSLDEFLIKRLIAGPGDQLVVNLTGVYVNGTLVETYFDSNYIASDNINLFPDSENTDGIIPPGKYFVMGDNRDDSDDSRYKDVGFISQEDMLGVVIYRMSGSTSQ